MNCEACKRKKAEISYPSLCASLCRSCFAKLIERKIRKTIRNNCPFERGEAVFLVDDSTAKSAVLKELLAETVFRHLITLKIIKKPAKTSKKTIIPWSTDDEEEQFLNYLFNNKKIRREKNIIKPLIHVTDEECELYCKIRKLKFKQQKPSEIKEFINKIEAKHPSTKYSLLKAIEELGV